MFNCPKEPIEPSPELKHMEDVSDELLYDYGVVDIPLGATHIKIYDINGDCATLMFCKEVVSTNPYYKKQLARYQKDLENYLKEKEWWEGEKIKMEAKEAANEELEERRLYKELKRKFEGKS